MYGIRVNLGKLNEAGEKVGDDFLWVLNLMESNSHLNPEENVLKFETYAEAEKTARDMRLKSYVIEEI